MPTSSHHEERNQSGKGLRCKPLPPRTIEALDARLSDAQHAGASVRMSEISTSNASCKVLPKRHIAPQFMHRLTSGEDTGRLAHKAKVAIVQATIWDFENLAGTLEPTQVSGLLNEFFGHDRGGLRSRRHAG